MSLSEEDAIIQYYVMQAGNGMGAIYSGPVYQRGYGIGSFLGGLFRAVLPILKSKGIAIGRNLFKTGVEVMGDLQNNKSLKTSIAERRNEFVDDMKKAVLTGKGYIRKKSKKRDHSPSINNKSYTIKKKKVAKKTKPKNHKHINDFFGKYYNGVH